jgi:hypothetical protein
VDDVTEKARVYATSAHARINQLRKYTRQPYDVHLKAVAELVAAVSDDPAMIAAAWLHDTVEDTPATFEDLEREFGADVTQLVKELTDVSRPGDGNRAVRKAIDRRHTAGASPRAKTVKLADIVDNTEDICRHDAKFGRVYVSEAEALLAVLAEGDAALYARAAAVTAACRDRLGRAAAAGAPGEQAHEGLGAAAGGRHGTRLFIEAFAARDLLEPLAPGDSATAERRQVVAFDTSLTDVIHVLTHFAQCFVEQDGAIVGVVGRGDIEKPVARMWLFGIIILIEVHAVGVIRAAWPGEDWTALVSAGRLEKARQLQGERVRRGLPADLLDCLQFSDKLQLAIQNPAFMEAAGFGSASAAKKVAKDLEALRNNLAHGQDVTRHDWAQIARLARRIQQMYGA